MVGQRRSLAKKILKELFRTKENNTNSIYRIAGHNRRLCRNKDFIQTKF